jgi:Acetyltransferase (GNAT) domain
MALDYVFRPMRAENLPMIRGWLETSEVMRWWGQPDEQYALLSGDLDHPDMDQFIVALDDHPFGYIQCYALSTWNQGFGSHPSNTRGIDQFIGISDMIGRGHGSWLHPAVRRPPAGIGHAARGHRPRPGQWPRYRCLCQGRLPPRATGRYARWPVPADGP